MADNDREIFDRLAKIEQTVVRIDEREVHIVPKIEKHEERIQTLELKDAKRGGFIAAIATVASVVVSALNWLLNHFIHFTTPGAN